MTDKWNFGEDEFRDNGSGNTDWNDGKRVIPLRVGIAQPDREKGDWEPVRKIASEGVLIEEGDDASEDGFIRVDVFFEELFDEQEDSWTEECVGGVGDVGEEA